MVIYRSLIAILRNPRNRPKPFLSPLSLPSAPASPPCAAAAAAVFSRNPFIRSAGFLSPLHGPLFLSFPPWKLLQSATPLLVQCDVVLPKRIELEALRLLERTKGTFPLKLGLKSVCDTRRRENYEENSAINNGGLVESFVNLPNLISISRLVSGPVLGWMIINEWYLPAFFGLAISGATDWLDGFLARRMGINSVVGSYLDPLADKVLIGCVALAMVENNLLHPGLVGLVVMRDVALVGGAAYKRASSLSWEWKSWFDFFDIDGTHPEKVEPLFISKVNTVFQLVLVAAALLQPELGTPETQSYITYLSWLVASTTVASTAAYGAQYMRNRSMLLTNGR